VYHEHRAGAVPVLLIRRMYDRHDFTWRPHASGLALHCVGRAAPVAFVVPDSRYPGIHRVKTRDGRLSNMVNLSRAKDAAPLIAMATLNRTGEKRRNPPP
jgi:hypothetical protein